MAVTLVETAAAFEALLAAHTAVIVDFYADWCAPCKAIAPFFQKLAAEYAAPGRLAFCKLNVDTLPDVAETHGVSAMPTFLFFVNGASAAVNVAPRKAGATAASEAADPATAQDVRKHISGANPRALAAAVARLAEIAQASAAPTS